MRNNSVRQPYSSLNDLTGPMHYFDRLPNLFRVLFGTLTAYLLLLAAFSFSRVASRPTDENLFNNPPSNLYVAKNIPATPVATNNGASDKVVRVGDLVVNVNGVPVFTMDDLREELGRTADSTIELGISRFSGGGSGTYRTSKARVATDAVRDIGPTARIIEVTGGGASDRAGVKVGDLIVRINGQKFKNSLDADRILSEGQVGKALVYDVLRDNVMLSLHVTIAAIGMPFPLIVSTLSGLFLFSTGAFLGLARPRFTATRLLGLSFVAFGFFIMVFLNRRGYMVGPVDRLRDITMFIFVFLVAPLSIHAGEYFPKERPELLTRPWIIRVAYVLAVLGMGATYFGRDLWFIISMGVIVVYSVVIGLVFRRKASVEYKRLNRIIRNASILTGIGGVLAGIYLFSSKQGADVGYMGFVFLLIPLSHLYTIGRYRLFGLDLRIRRNVQYILVSSLWVILLGYVAFRVLFWFQGMELPIPNIRITASSVEVLNTPLQLQQRVWLEKGILMLMAVVVVYVSWKVAQRGQALIDTRFFRAQHDYRKAANELAEVMATKLTMVDLARGMVEKLAGLMQLKRVGVLFFRDERACCCQEAYGFDGSAWADFCMTSGAGISSALRELETESSVDDLPDNAKNEFRRNGFLYITPIRSKEKLVGALLVGEKRSESAYQQDDLDFLGAVARQAAVAIENAFLYEELAEQERLKHELAIARRIQMASLPQGTPSIDGLEIAGASQPALEVGGDYFDYLNGDPGAITIIVGDVSGKGTSAALYMSKIQGILRSLHAFGLSPKELFVRTNKLLCSDMEKSSFVTAIGAAFDTRRKTILLARAGHLPLYRFNAHTGLVEVITPRGLGLGLEATDLFSSELEERAIAYQSNDVFVFVSDGITEAEGGVRGQFGDEKLMGILKSRASESAQTILDHILLDVREFASGVEQHDDQTVVIVKAL